MHFTEAQVTTILDIISKIVIGVFATLAWWQSRANGSKAKIANTKLDTVATKLDTVDHKQDFNHAQNQQAVLDIQKSVNGVQDNLLSAAHKQDMSDQREESSKGESK